MADGTKSHVCGSSSDKCGFFLFLSFVECTKLFQTINEDMVDLLVAFYTTILKKLVDFPNLEGLNTCCTTDYWVRLFLTLFDCNGLSLDETPAI